MREKFKQVFKMERDGLTAREMVGGRGERKNLQPDTFDVIRSKSHITYSRAAVCEGAGWLRVCSIKCWFYPSSLKMSTFTAKLAGIILLCT